MRQTSKSRICSKLHEYINDNCISDDDHYTVDVNTLLIPLLPACALVSLRSLYRFTTRSSVIIKNTLNPFNASSVFDLGKRNEVAKTRNVVLKIQTYNRLERYKIELIKRKEDPKVTYDDVINDLLGNMLELSLDPKRK